MEIKRYTSIRTATYAEQQAVLAKFPRAFFVQRDQEIFDFFLPIYEDEVVREFVFNWHSKDKKKIPVMEKKGE